jgi:uncharacterized protein YjaG (DUF416 family)
MRRLLISLTLMLPLAAAAQTAPERAAIAKARAVLAEMHALAKTPEERKLVAADAASIARLETLVTRRHGTRSSDEMLQVARQVQEVQKGFDLQYLQLQSQMQSENRSYTAVSNILKTRHDTVKNSISNIR